jgi:hypothetical protein
MYGMNNIKFKIFVLEDKATTSFRNTGQQTPRDGVQYPRRKKITTALLQKPETLQINLTNDTY